MNNNMNENTKATNTTQDMNNEEMFKNNVSLEEMEAIEHSEETTTPETSDTNKEINSTECHKYDNKKMQMGTFYGGINGNNDYEGKVIRFKISGTTDDDMAYISQELGLSIKRIYIGATLGDPYTIDFTGIDSIDFCINVDNIIDKSHIIKLINFVFDRVAYLMTNRENALSINILKENIE